MRPVILVQIHCVLLLMCDCSAGCHNNTTCNPELYGETEKCFALSYDKIDKGFNTLVESVEVRGCLWRTEQMTAVRENKKDNEDVQVHFEKEVAYQTLSDVLDNKLRGYVETISD